MARNPFIDRLAKKGYSKRLCEKFMIDASQAILESLVAGESVSLKGLGRFETSKIPEHLRYDFVNPDKLSMTREAVTIKFSTYNSAKKQLTEQFVVPVDNPIELSTRRYDGIIEKRDRYVRK